MPPIYILVDAGSDLYDLTVIVNYKDVEALVANGAERSLLNFLARCRDEGKHPTTVVKDVLNRAVVNGEPKNESA